MRHRLITLQVQVKVPATTGENEVEEALNARYDEPPCDWGDWEVGRVMIVDVQHA